MSSPCARWISGRKPVGQTLFKQGMSNDGGHGVERFPAQEVAFLAYKPSGTGTMNFIGVIQTAADYPQRSTFCGSASLEVVVVCLDRCLRKDVATAHAFAGSFLSEAAMRT
ncbi:hypothetical protein T265_04951 [Opisthorchis viverrini]|uniref:Uncharacterized protein n=1 Tax=Opisthorchis viverrini TaxID=6198 RepID=A0A074ZLI8_OPIVI|nr:hypothetical protein T265_04951 [Opisthorchis viverrini]KER28198.1 hypothetical protein T265_04951 [Opisthorchis viverrini]